MRPNEYTEPVTVNKAGTRCVVETNWERRSGPRCQMIWQVTPEGVMITTCRQDVPAIPLTAQQCATVGQWLRDISRPGTVRE